MSILPAPQGYQWIFVPGDRRRHLSIERVGCDNGYREVICLGKFYEVKDASNVPLEDCRKCIINVALRQQGNIL